MVDMALAYSAIYDPLHFHFGLHHCLDVGYFTATVRILPSDSRRQNESVIDRILLNSRIQC